MPVRPSGKLCDGDAILLIDRKHRQYLKTLRAGGKLSVRGGKIDCDALIGLAEGSRIQTSMGDWFLALRPTYAQLVPNLPRAAQVIYPKDVGSILVWGDVRPGATVVEAGVGAGALTIALLRVIGPEGRLVSYESREDHIEMARGNVARFYGEAPHWTVKQGDVYEDVTESDVDRVLLDVPEPWRALPAAARVLVPGGVFVGYLPTVLQVKTLVDELARHPQFGAVETFETLQRFWFVGERSIRPEHRMVAHTGFITVARRLA
jgi:tRNA (adenine57-N1/adenine58-N1)-methyltransferase catalytic subunit